MNWLTGCDLIKHIQQALSDTGIIIALIKIKGSDTGTIVALKNYKEGK